MSSHLKELGLGVECLEQLSANIKMFFFYFR